MKKINPNEIYAKKHDLRYRKTYAFIRKHIDNSDLILDLGPPNPFSEMLSDMGFDIYNTNENQDLDFDYDIVKDEKFTVVTAFEIMEHLVSPFPLIKEIKAKKLFISVPLNLWFASAYWSETDPYDRHYHEFEPKQLQMLVNKAGWTIHDEDKWISPTGFKIGFRPILRRFYPRHYIVFCKR